LIAMVGSAGRPRPLIAMALREFDSEIVKV